MGVILCFTEFSFWFCFVLHGFQILELGSGVLHGVQSLVLWALSCTSWSLVSGAVGTVKCLTGLLSNTVGAFMYLAGLIFWYCGFSSVFHCCV